MVQFRVNVINGTDVRCRSEVPVIVRVSGYDLVASQAFDYQIFYLQVQGERCIFAYVKI